MRRSNRRRIVTGILLSVALVLGAGGCSKAETGTGDTDAASKAGPTDMQEAVDLHIQAAASLKDALNEVTEAYSAQHPEVTFTINYDSAGNLQAQIEQGAPADIFIPAAKKYMDSLEEAGLLLDGTRTDVLSNSLVVVVPKGRASGIKSLADLASAELEVVALGDPESVPAGKYALQAMEAAGVKDSVMEKAILGKDVRSVLTYVETGDADAGVVYRSDALISTAVDTACTIDPSMHEPVVYPAAVIKTSREHKAAQAFIEHLTSPQAQAVFEKFGFSSVR